MSVLGEERGYERTDRNPSPAGSVVLQGGSSTEKVTWSGPSGNPNISQQDLARERQSNGRVLVHGCGASPRCDTSLENMYPILIDYSTLCCPTSQTL
eukprot:6635984-Pyramimonas_sp.AAC.1